MRTFLRYVAIVIALAVFLGALMYGVMFLFYRTYFTVDLHGKDVRQETRRCVEAMALGEGDCEYRKDMDCETLVRMYEALCSKDGVYIAPK